jgi:hypothetical protein
MSPTTSLVDTGGYFDPGSVGVMRLGGGCRGRAWLDGIPPILTQRFQKNLRTP